MHTHLFRYIILVRVNVDQSKKEKKLFQSLKPNDIFTLFFSFFPSISFSRILSRILSSLKFKLYIRTNKSEEETKQKEWNDETRLMWYYQW